MDLCLLLGAILAATPAWVHRDGWNTADGLPQSSVTDVAQGHDGLLYLTTFGGPARFDGRRFERSATPDAQGWSTIRTTALAIGPDGTQWLGLQDGGVICQPATGISEQLVADPSLAGIGISDMGVAPSGVWVVSSAGAAYYDEGWTVASSEPWNTVATDGAAVYIGGPDGLRRCDPQCSTIDLGEFGEVNDVATQGGTLFVAGAGGLLRLTGDTMTTLEHAEVERVAVSSDGAVWGARDGIAFLHGSDVRLDAGSRIRRLFVDREQNLWLATDRHGLQRGFLRDWRLTESEGSMPLLELPDGTIWLGDDCSDGGMARLRPKGALPPAVPGCVRALATAPDGEVWVGADGEVWKGPVGETPQHVHGFDHPILSLLPEPNGTWVGTDGEGAYRIHETGVERVDVGDDRVLAIASGRDGVVWFGTHLGLTRRHPTEGTQRWTRAEGVPAGPVRTLLVDPDGTVWMGSYGGGLGVLRDGRIHRIGVKHGLQDETVSAILDDRRGSLWLNGNRGIVRVARSELEALIADSTRTLQVRRWATPEGNGGTQPAGIVSTDGTLWFATISGVVSLNPAKVFRNTVVPEVIVLAADVDGVPLVAGETTIVPPGPGRVQVQFTAGTLRRPELASLEYRLVAQDTDADAAWKPLADDHSVMWGGVEPGDHTIELRAANEDGLRSRAVQLRFELQEVWYERPGVWIAAVCGLGLLGLALQRWRTQEVQRQNDALSREVEQRSQAEQALRLSEAHYRRVFEGGADALMVIKGGRVEHANPAANEVVGRPATGCTLDTLFGEESAEDGARPVLRDGAEAWVSVVELPFDSDRTLVRATDVTRRLHAERERRQMSQRLSQAERMETVGQLAGGIAHDFNNLLTAVGGTAELLSETAAAGDDHESLSLLDGLQSRVDRGAKLTRQLLSFARRQHLEPVAVDLGSMLSELRTILRPSLRDDIIIGFELPDEALGVHADTGQLELALLNLVLNSQAALPTGGSITIRIRAETEASALAMWPSLDGACPSGWVVLDVVDDGVGIAAKDLPHVLDPFFTTREEGTGLGLPSAHGFALQSGGGLFLQSAVGDGTTVSLVLPRTDPPPPKTAVLPPKSHPGQGRVLVVDDDDMVRSTVVQMLRSSGYETIDYSDPQKLLEDFDPDFECDALVTDVLMPGVSGPKLASAILQQRPDLPVIFTSGYLDESDEALPGPLLSKPFRGTALLALVASALDAKKEERRTPA